MKKRKKKKETLKCIQQELHEIKEIMKSNAEYNEKARRLSYKVSL